MQKRENDPIYTEQVNTFTIAMRLGIMPYMVEEEDWETFELFKTYIVASDQMKVSPDEGRRMRKMMEHA